MKQASLKLKMYTKGISIINNNTEGFILNIIFWSFGALSLFYVLLLGNMVYDIVQRRSFEADARSLSQEVRTLELTYLSMSNDVDLALSYSMGFKEAKPVFATRKSLGLGIPLGNIKIAKNDL